MMGLSSTICSLRDHLLQQFVLGGGSLSQYRDAFHFPNSGDFHIAKLTLRLLIGWEELYQAVNELDDVLDF
jgi:hypothetical protein